jgi:S-adenosylmethionine decarboxylase
MFFEGSEKKFELISHGARFRERPEMFFHSLVEMSGAKVLSKISNRHIDAYLLSESSLFVSDDCITMLTCGQTSLVRSAAFLIDHVGPERLEFLSYERKNEYFPHRQETDFYRDVEMLKTKIPGVAYRFGFSDEHHLMVFHLDKPYRPRKLDCTLEVLMYNLQGPARALFDGGQTLENIRKLSELDRIFPGFQINDHLFQPCGYSLNAIKGPEYYTVHVTPEEDASYVSFETNIPMGEKYNSTVRNILEVFQPRSFDVIYFHPEREMVAFDLEPFVRSNYVSQSLSCGFELSFATYFVNTSIARPAVALDLET